MVQNNTYMRYLCTGLIFSFAILLNSCKDDFYNQFGEYHYINNTNYEITYEANMSRYNVAPKSTTIIKRTIRGVGKKSATVANYEVPTDLYSGEPTIKFNNLRCLIKVKADDVNSVRNIKNYVAEKISENNFKFTHTFTDADFNRAVACP